MFALSQKLSTLSLSIIKFDKKLKERFFNTYQFSNHDKNKFILLLQKLVYAYEYMDDW